MFKALFIAILIITLLVNLAFLFANKEKSPDLVSSTFAPSKGHIIYETNSSRVVGQKRRLFLRSNFEPGVLSDDAIDPGSGSKNESTNNSPAWLERDFKLDKSSDNGTDPSRYGSDADRERVAFAAEVDHITSNVQLPKLDDVPSSNGISQDDRWLDIRLKSSKNHVLVSVDDNIIYEVKSSDPTATSLFRSSLTSDNKFLFRQQPSSDNDLNSKLLHYPTSAKGQQRIKQIDDANNDEATRGIHVIVLNQYNGNVMSKRHYDTYVQNQDKELLFYLNMIQDGRIIILAVKDEASFGMSSDSMTRKLIAKLGSRFIMDLKWRDMWACVLVKKTLSETDARPGRLSSAAKGAWINDSRIIAESLNKSPKFTQWAEPVELRAHIKLIDTLDADLVKCQDSWLKQANRSILPSLALNDQIEMELERRKEFCSRVEGYGRVCDCSYPNAITFKSRQIVSSQLEHVPIIVMAGNRPYYLYRTLRSLLSADGINSSMITVFIDGFYEEPILVSKLLNLRAIQNQPQGRRGARISHHYKTSLTKTFDLFPKAELVIVFEEDLDVARDTFTYFNQTVNILKSDQSLYCVSAWNDQGYIHTSGDPRMLYRVETMPGLGWMLKRTLFKDELEPRWPTFERAHDWDMWLRMDNVRKGRECIIPDISRTFHFGSIGTNINAYFQSLYFNKHAFNVDPLEPDGSDQFKNLNKISPSKVYDDYIEQVINNSLVLNISTNVNITAKLCSLAFEKIQSESLDKHPKILYNNNNNNLTIVIYIKMESKQDYKNWLKLASCWKIWDLDPRGQHKSMWSLFLAGRPSLVIGWPASPYSHLKPSYLSPYVLTN